MDAELEAVRELAALLPPGQARDVVECWDIGEQEAGLDLLTKALAEGGIPIDGDQRAQVAVTAEAWGVRESLTPALRRCRSRAGGAVRLIDDDVPLVPPTSTDLVIVPWIACALCPETLSRAHLIEPWGDLSYLAEHYVLSPARLFGPEDVWGAFTALRACSTASSR
ncbi:hypothetical protein [Saccharothrix sp. NRRL B-16314]|uniref:hypothetical protein n=1 Tax=Saccharothrix sp. NRRL B-16314 TaxID=1463825 RepID=UPI0005241429|nr:hypothetical protein [Saccharothrix sp. NRRL B-16314]